MNAKLSFKYDQHFKFPYRNTGFIFKVNQRHVNMYFPNSNLEGNFSTHVFGKSFWHFRELKIDCWTLGHILCKNILNTFVCVEVTILVENLYIWRSQFPEVITTNMQIGNDFLCINSRLRVNKKFPNSHYLLKLM